MTAPGHLEATVYYINALKQKGLYSESLDHIESRGPGKDREPAVLGGDERDGIALVLDKLGG